MSSGEQYKKSRIVNWRQYNQALVCRGDIAFWFPDDIQDIWFFHGEKEGRGCFLTYSDTAIQICLMIRAVFKLTLRSAEGFVNSVFRLMEIPLTSPDYTLLSKRGKILEVCIGARVPDKGIDVVFDGTGLKVYGEGEWKVREYGAGKRRTWRRLHLAVCPDNHDVIGVELTTVQIGVPEILPRLLNQPENLKVNNAYGDGAFDTRGCYDAVARHGGHAVIPPRRNAVYWQAGHPRNEATAACRKHGRKTWKKASGYHRRSIPETAVYRFKRLIGADLSARDLARQRTEAYVGAAVINRMNTLGMPVRG